MRTRTRRTRRPACYIGAHRSVFVTYLPTDYDPRHGAGVADLDMAA